MDISVHFFAVYGDRSGTKFTNIALPTNATVETLVNAILALYPNLVSDSQHLVVAVNSEYADYDLELSHGDEVALIPPVSGGSDDQTN